MPIWLIAPAG